MMKNYPDLKMLSKNKLLKCAGTKHVKPIGENIHLFTLA